MTLEERNKLVEENFHVVRILAYKMLRKIPYGTLLDDLISYGCIGLIQAAEKFDPSRGTTFQTFAYPRINGAMKDGARNEDHLSRTHRSELKKKGQTFHVGSLSRMTKDVDWTVSSTEDASILAERKEWWNSLTMGFRRKEKLVFLLYWKEELSMQEVGQVLGLQESRISQIVKVLMKRVRERLGSDCNKTVVQSISPRPHKKRKKAA